MGSGNGMTEARQIAQTLGIVVGAASCCEQVTEERVNAVAVKLRELVAATADDDSDADLANEQFSAALEEGKTAVESGRIDPEQAVVALNELEQQLSA
jgi:glutamate/tyrosine decarboxylase-like PLP-dependent enzyme